MKSAEEGMKLIIGMGGTGGGVLSEICARLRELENLSPRLAIDLSDDPEDSAADTNDK